jgi:DUF4097 and DUF4098 domain-containing protein YvlB
MTMRPLSLLLLPLLATAATACASHVAHADPPPRPDDESADIRARAHDIERRAHDREREWRDRAARASGDSAAIDETRDAKPNGEIDVHGFAGTVHVTGWAQNQLKVHANVSGDCRVEVSPSGDRLEVRLSCSHGPGSGDMSLQVPQASTLDVRTMSATISVAGVSGPLRLQSVTADIDVKGGAPGEVEARSTSGSIRIDAASPQTRAQSVSGDVTIASVHGKASVHTVSGDCKIAGGEFSDVRVETVSGDVSFTGAITGSLEVSTHSGDVGLHVPATTGADAELRSFSGDLLVDLGDGKRQKGSHELDAKLGAGGARIRARTFSGDVSIVR